MNAREPHRRIQVDDLNTEQQRELLPLLEEMRRAGRLSWRGGAMLAKLRRKADTARRVSGEADR